MLVPWQSGCSAMWDVTIARTLAMSYVSQNVLQAGSGAAATSARKTTKYSTSVPATFFPVVLETLGSLSDEVHSLIVEIGRRATLCTADPWETTFLYQCISVAIQCFNAVCLASMFTVSEFPS